MIKCADDIKGVVLLACLVLVESIQLVIILGLVSSFIPFDTSSLAASLFLPYKNDLRPEREIEIYHAFIAVNICASAWGVYRWREHMGSLGFQENIKRLILADGGWVLLQLFAAFKIFIYGDPWWARGLLYAALAGSVLSRVCWSRLSAHVPVIRFNSLKSIKVWDQKYLWWTLWVTATLLQVLILVNGYFPQVPLRLYGLFIIATVILGAFSLRRFTEEAYSKGFILVETGITCLLLSAAYKVVVYSPRGMLAQYCFYVLSVAVVLNKIFYTRIARAAQEVYGLFTYQQNAVVVRTAADFAFMALIIAMVYIPDPLAVLAKIFIGEQFNHMDHFVMAPGWAYVSGAVLNVEVISRYGAGLPMVLAFLSKALGGFSYLNILILGEYITIAYLLASYIFLRVWLKNILLSMAAIFVLIKLQMFYSLAYPQPYTYLSAMPVRFLFDIIFMFCVLGHVKSHKRIYLYLAGLSCASALFYMMETGLYLTAAFYAYLLLRVMIRSTGIIEALACALAVPAAALGLFWLQAGAHIFTIDYWHNTLEWGKYFTNGLRDGPFYGGLPYKQFWDLLIGFLFPVVYILTITIVGTLCAQGRIPVSNLLVVIICIYGLGCHHYYVGMSTLNNYYMRSLPFVFALFFWIHWALSLIRKQLRRAISAVLVVFCAFCLWTNHHFLGFPNIFNFSRNPLIDPLVAETLPDGGPYFNHKLRGIPEDMKMPLNSLGVKDEDIRFEYNFDSQEDLKQYYLNEINFNEDAALIQSLVPPDQPAALLGSFETEMLMQANRRPLFYYYSSFSRPMHARTFPTFEIMNQKHLDKYISQLENAVSPYLFMERIYLNQDVPSRYWQNNEGLMRLLSYVRQHYSVIRQGKYLVALKRNQGL